MATHPRLFSPYDKTMWDSVDEGRMCLQRCAQCATFRYPPGPACQECLSTEATWEPLSGDGRLLSWTTFHRQYLSAYPPPTTVVVVTLAEGPIIISNIDAQETGLLKAGIAMKLIYGDHPDGYRLPRFRLAEAGR